MSGLNEQDARALTYLAGRIRQETYGAGPWDDDGTMANLRKLLGRNLAIVAEQVVCHASDAGARTPGVLAGPHLAKKPSERDPERFHPPRSEDACPTCGGYCPSGKCLRDADGPDDEPPAERLPMADALARMRADVAGAKGARS